MGTLDEYHNRRKKRQRRLNRNWMTLIGIVGITIGIVLTIISLHFPSWFPKKWEEVFSSIFMSGGQVALSISVTSMLFEHFGYVDYTVNRVCDALADDAVLNVLTDSRKKQLKDILFEDIYLGRQPAQAPKELVEQLDGDIDTLLEDYYYEEYYTSCDISMVTAQDGQRYFRKHIHRALTIRPIRKEKSCRVTRVYYLRTNDIPSGTRDLRGDPLQPVKFLQVTVNNRELAEGTDYSLEDRKDKDAGPYSINYVLKLKDESLLEIGERLRIELVYLTHVLSTDPLYAVTVDKPCKFFSCHIHNTMSDYNLHAKSYGFMAFGDSTRRMLIETQSGVNVRFRSWILPGDGAVVVLTPKQSVPACPIHGGPPSPACLGQAFSAVPALDAGEPAGVS